MNNKKHIYISHGNKGGTGKSFLAVMIGSIYELYDIPFLLIDTDANQVGGQPDVGPRFERSSKAQVVYAPLTGEDSAEDLLAELFEIIENYRGEHIILNTPAGASEQLERVGELIGMTCSDLEIDIHVFYNVFNSTLAVKQAEDLLTGSIARYATDYYIVKNKFFGLPQLTPALEKLPCFTLPIIHSNVIDRLNQNENFAQILSTLPAFQRAQLSQAFTNLANNGFLTALNIINNNNNNNNNN
uniref:hypothetical protein n=1 Tax=Thiomicrospira microaerophila TaxID=406020 RepID=UPI0005C964E0